MSMHPADGFFSVFDKLAVELIRHSIDGCIHVVVFSGCMHVGAGHVHIAFCFLSLFFDSQCNVDLGDVFCMALDPFE